MINIRSGLVYNISNNNLSKQHINEIFYWSNDVKYISILKVIQEILMIDPNINYIPPIDFDIMIYFDGYYDIAYHYLKNVGMNVLSFYFLEHCKFKIIDNPIAAWNKNTKGLKEEELAIFRFNNIYGYKIGKAKRGSYIIKEHNLLISGTPDGIVESSPGGIFDDYIVEIKYQPRITSECKIRNKYQISSYCKIFNKPVLLIILTGNNYIIHRFTLDCLNKFWNDEVVPKLIKGIGFIKKFVKVESLDDLNKYTEFIDNI
jgi:hypothetical protein